MVGTGKCVRLLVILGKVAQHATSNPPRKAGGSARARVASNKHMKGLPNSTASPHENQRYA